MSRKTASQSTAWALIVRDTVSGFMTTAHHALMILGVGAIIALAFIFVRPDITDHLKALSPFTVNTIADPLVSSELPVLMDTPSKSFAQSTASSGKNLVVDSTLGELNSHRGSFTQQQQAVASWLSKRYRVASDATKMLVSAAYKTADELKLDPLLILAVAAIESGFNPFAESAMGAQGLMQVMSKVHHDKFQQLGGVKAALNPVANMKVGALILKDYVQRGGSVEAGLKMYVGAAAFESDSGYGSKVLGEYRRLKEVASGKNVPVFTTTASKTSPKAGSSDVNEQKPNASEEKSALMEPQERPIANKEQFVAL